MFTIDVFYLGDFIVAQNHAEITGKQSTLVINEKLLQIWLAIKEKTIHISKCEFDIISR